MSKRPDKYERFLTGYMTVRRFCQETGSDDIACELFDVFFGLQEAHSKIVRREAKALTLGIIRSYQEGKIGKGKMITDAQVATHLGLSRKELRVLDNLRDSAPRPPSDPLDRVKELNRVTADLRLQNGKLSALLVAKVFGVSLREMARPLRRSESEIKSQPAAGSLQKVLTLFAKVARLRAVALDEAFRKWLRAPNRELDDRTPLAVMLRGQGQIVAWLVSDMLTGAPV